MPSRLSLRERLRGRCLRPHLFNRKYIQNLTIQAGNSGFILGTPSDPQMFGITFKARQ
jgi:hypothetical protein